MKKTARDLFMISQIGAGRFIFAVLCEKNKTRGVLERGAARRQELFEEMITDTSHVNFMSDLAKTAVCYLLR